MAIFERDVTIVGAGPAGSICASYLARAGVDVLLLEKDVFPRDKACGDVFREGFVSHMEALGAARALDAMSTCVRRAEIISDDGHETIIPFECYCAPRYDVDRLLAETAEACGAQLKQSCSVTSLVTERGAVRGVKALYRGEETEIRSRLVIGADGAFSIAARVAGTMKEDAYSMWLGARAYFEGVKLDSSMAKDQYDAYGIFAFSHLLGTGYFWIMPVGRYGVERGICNIGFMVQDREAYEAMDTQRCFYDWAGGNAKIAAMLEGARRVSEWRGGRMNDAGSGSLKAGNGFMAIGDAAALVMPMSNDGLTKAADSAKAAAEAAMDALAGGDFTAGALMSSYERHLRGRSANKLTDELREKRLLMESMKDPGTMNRVIELLDSDQVFRRKHLR